MIYLFNLTQHYGDVVINIVDFPVRISLSETVARSEDVSVRDERSSTPPCGPALCRPQVQIGRPGELIHLSKLSSDDCRLVGLILKTRSVFANDKFVKLMQDVTRDKAEKDI